MRRTMPHGGRGPTRTGGGPQRPRHLRLRPAHSVALAVRARPAGCLSACLTVCLAAWLRILKSHGQHLLRRIAPPLRDDIERVLFPYARRMRRWVEVQIRRLHRQAETYSAFGACFLSSVWVSKSLASWRS